MANKTKSDSESLKKEIDASAKMFDVAGPGKTPATATSRPIIVKHGSMLQHDPMVVKDEPAKSSKSEPAKTVTRELKIEPPSDKTDKNDKTEEAEAPETKADAIVDEQPETDNDKNDVQPSEEATQETTQETADTSQDSSSGAVDSLINEVDAKQADKKQKRELEEKILELEKSIESKEFFVPIGVASRRRSARRLISSLILVILLGIAGINFAVDAEILDIGIKALTDLL